MRQRLAMVAAVAALVLSACSGNGATQAPGNTSAATAGATAAASGGTAGGCLIGVSWNNYDQERWKKADEPAIKAAIAAGGGTYTSTDAHDSSDQQNKDITTLINKGVKVIILLAKDATAVTPAVQQAEAAGIQIIGYDRLIEDPKALYITFDNQKVGTIMAQVLLGVQPQGNYAVIKGDPGDPNAAFLRAGMDLGGLKDAVTSGKVKIVGEQNTPNWDTTGAKNEMQAILNANNNKVDAVLSENDGMATGVSAALQAVGLTIPLSGQDGDAAALNRVALGTQTVSVWKNAFALGETAGNAAIQLCAGTALTAVKAPSDLPAASKPADLNTHLFTTPGNNQVSSFILTPTPIQQANLGDVISAGWVTKDQVCTGVAAGKVAACG
ncbi:MAG TPA: substrate-binding domain-containing protein [Candidatus Dormibacteraeota bacterium]|nr:substrate-binding domain-containing protein [Candidatus Dormibacteraeota bacterium]